MKVLSIFIPGRYEDAYVYRGRLILLTESLGIRVCYLERIAEFLEAQYPRTKPIPTLMFSRNDWLVGAAFKTLMRSEKVAGATVSLFNEFPQPYVKINESFLSEEQELEVPAQVILDLTIYNDRLYLGADSGFYHQTIEWEKEETNLHGKPMKRHDARCMGVSARFGAVNASCGDDGLFSSVDDFGWISGDHHNGMKLVASKSKKSSWLNFSLVNYASYSRPSLLQNTRRETDASGVEKDRAIVTDVGTNEIDINSFIREKNSATLERRHISLDTIEYSFNSNSALFLQTADGHFYSFGIRQPQEGDPRVSSTKSYRGVETQILSASTIRPGVVVETHDEVLLLVRNKWSTLIAEQALSVRTFMRSKRFQNLVAVITEEGILLSGIFDDHDTAAYKWEREFDNEFS
jgi:hypothetical protein